MALASLLGRRGRRAAVLAVYGGIVERARDPIFYEVLGVPDTLDGRFEVLALHGFLVLHRLRRERDMTAHFAQDLFDAMFADLDRGLREMGASDLGVGRYVKEMAQAFYGRIAAYDQGMAAPEALVPALRRNLFGTAAPSDAQLAAMVAYTRRQAAALALQPIAAILAGTMTFAPVETG